MNYDDLRAKALAATPGPWYAADWDEDDGSDTTTVEAREPEVISPGQSNIWPDGIARRRVAITHDGERPLEDSAFIAAANPATVLSLLDEIAAQYRAGFEAAREAAAVWATHHIGCATADEIRAIPLPGGEK